MTQQENTTNKNNNGCAFVMIVVLIVAVYAWCTGKSERETRIAEKPAEKCLSAWDGSHPGMVRATKDMMNDPKSFEHVETRYIDRGDEIDLVMTFTGKNAFGGTIKQVVSETIDKDCNLIKGPALVKI